MHSPVVLRRRPKKLLKRMKAISMGHRRLGRRSRWLMQEPAAVHPLPERSLRIQRLLTIPTERPSRRTTTQQRPRRARCRRLLCRPCSNLIPALARGVLLPRLLLTRLLPGLFPEGGRQTDPSLFGLPRGAIALILLLFFPSARSAGVRFFLSRDRQHGQYSSGRSPMGG